MYPTALPCRRRPRHRPCPGRLQVLRDDESTEIHWRCPSCDEAGVISNWRGTVWDLTSKPSRDWYYADDRAGEVLLDEQAYDVLRKHVPLGEDPDLERIVAAALLTGIGVMLVGFESDLAALRGYVEEAACGARGRRQAAHRTRWTSWRAGWPKRRTPTTGARSRSWAASRRASFTAC